MMVTGAANQTIVYKKCLLDSATINLAVFQCNGWNPSDICRRKMRKLLRKLDTHDHLSI